MTTLNQSDKLALSALFRHEDDEGMEPLPTAPLFDYSAYRDKIKGHVQRPLHSFAHADETEDTEDIDLIEDCDEHGASASDESEISLDDDSFDEEEFSSAAFTRHERAYEDKPWELPSSRHLGEVFSTLSSMGCEW